MKIWPHSFPERVNKMSNLVGCHRESELFISQTNHPKTRSRSTQTTFQSKCYCIFGQREGGFQKRDHQEEFLGLGGGGKVDRGVETTTHLSSQSPSRGEIPEEEHIHDHQGRGSSWPPASEVSEVERERESHCSVVGK
jgi:hypothetical protein